MEWALGIGAALVLVVLHDVLQKKHAILRNFPLVGHFRYWLETIGPELRQYIVTSNNEERPFSRDQRRWIYASSKKQNNYFGFGTDNDIENSSNYVIVKHSAFALSSPRSGDEGYDPDYSLPCAKVLGAPRKRQKAFRPRSVVNVSAMSFGSLGSNAIEALNRGAQLAGCLHNTGEGGVSPHHRKGGDLIWQIGTGYFGCRDEQGGFDLKRLQDTVAETPAIKAVEIKLSQGAKPGLGGLLPASKITPLISRIRGIPMGQDCVSPARHTAFDDVDSLLDLVERIAEETGLPVGIKSAVGQEGFWRDLADAMAKGGRGVDYIQVDGGEGGTGAAPLTFTDHVAYPFVLAMPMVYRIFAERGLHESVVWIGSGKLGLPERALYSFALGCDLLALAREPMLSIGCIQAQKCHTGHCPTGVATHNRWLVRGLEPETKAKRLANYIATLRKELLSLSRACGVVHPALIVGEHVDVLDHQGRAVSVNERHGYDDAWGTPSAEDCARLSRILEECRRP